MRIQKAMTKPVVVVQSDDSALHASLLLERHRINQLPVVDEGRLVGIVTDRDLRDAFAAVLPIHGRRNADSLREEPDLVDVEDVMTREVLTLEPEDSVESAARLMRRERIGAIPIVDSGGSVVGILSRTDVLSAYLNRKTSDRPAEVGS